MLYLLSILLGAITCAALFIYVMQRYMLVTHKINGDFDEINKDLKTVVAQFEGWSCPLPEWEFHESQLQKNLKYRNIKNMIMHFVCNPSYANKILSVTPKMGGMMPCTWAVYETIDGEVYIAKMNVSLMSLMFFGVLGKTMGDVANTEKKMLKKLKAMHP